MTDRLRQILDSFHKYNTEHMANLIFGLDEDVLYDALVVAPSFTPPKILPPDEGFTVRQTAARGYISGFEVEKEGVRIAWIQTASGSCNLIDHLLLCGELRFKRLIFIGAVGALKPHFDLGDVCTPTSCISGTMAPSYLGDSLREHKLFETVLPKQEDVDDALDAATACGHTLKPASVFCTDSIIMEYTHLDEIRAFGTDLIEMETAAFYETAEIIGVPAVALLVVSDNSAAGVPLLGRTPEQDARYKTARTRVLTDLIWNLAKR